MKGKRVAVAMSGGVDSSVAAALLKEKEYQVTGVTMKIWDGEETPDLQTRHACYGPGEAEDIRDAQKVAEKLDIDLHVIDLCEEYRKDVLEYFNLEYLSGRTPNPCLMCNRSIKFQALINKAQNAGIEFDYFATGHYCRTEYNQVTGRYLLKKGKDANKDQSYFLAFLSQSQLRNILFPIGEYTKQEVRDLARKYELGIEEKPESQDFVANGYRSILSSTQPGNIVNTSGEKLGEHRGITNYTIGQRKGLGISSKDPLYVTEIDSETNTITVGGREDIYSDELVATGLNWITIEQPEREMEIKAKIRSSHEDAKAILVPINKERVRVKFREPQMAITPGQAVVFYRDDEVIGGGTIERSGGNENG